MNRVAKLILTIIILWSRALLAETEKIIYLVPFGDAQSFIPENKDCYRLGPFIKLLQDAHKYHYTIKVTQDISDSRNVVAVVLFNLNYHNTNVHKYLHKYPLNKRILYVWEAPAVDQSGYDADLKNIFGKIFTFRDDLVDNKNYFKFYYPSLLPFIFEKIPFNEKKFCSIFAGYKNSLHEWELYSKRIKAINFFEKLEPQNFDLFGIGWNRYQYSSYRGFVSNKLITLKHYKFNLCYENIENIKGYVTEKIFDCFAASCVPLYWGAPNVLDFIPADCFIDCRSYKSLEDLYVFLKEMDEKTYNHYLEAAAKFVYSSQAYVFSGDYFVQQFFHTINTIQEG